MPKNIAVVTDAVSPDYIFPYWAKYYGDLFGCKHLYVLTYTRLAERFQAFGLGGVIELPVSYSDGVRKTAISHLISSLLSCYDFVIRVDTDEFLVVDPRVASSLAMFMNDLNTPYLTARGFDVIQTRGDMPLPAQPSKPLLAYRSYAYPNTALNKTSIVSGPVTWCEGFHWANVYPRFGPLFLLHMKRVDVAWQLGWFTTMSESIDRSLPSNKDLLDYYAPDEQRIRDYHDGVESRPRIGGLDNWYRDELTNDFLLSIHLSDPDGLYCGKYGHENVLCEIPLQWKSII